MTSFFTGPVLVTGLSATVHPSLGLATSTILIIVAVILLITDRPLSHRHSRAGLGCCSIGAC